TVHGASDYTSGPHDGALGAPDIGSSLHHLEGEARDTPERTRHRTEGVPSPRGTGEGSKGTDRGPRNGREETEGVGTPARVAPRGTGDLRCPRQSRVPQARCRHVCRRSAPPRTRDRGVEEPLRAHGQPVRADPPGDVRGGTGPRDPHPGPGRRWPVARRGRVQRRREDADQRGLAIRHRTGTRVDAADRPHLRAHEDAVHRRRRPGFPGHGGLAGALRPEAPADGGGLREGHPDHPPRRGRGQVPRPDPRHDDAEPGVAGGSPRMSYVDDMRRELELLVKHHQDVPLPPEDVPDFRTFQYADPAKEMIAVDGSYSFLLNLSSWWLALISVGLLRYAFDGHAFRRKDWRLVQ